MRLSTMEGKFMENLGYLLQDDDIPQAVKRRSVKEKSKSVQLENVSKKYLFAKRAIDVILSFCAVAVLSVPMLLIALVVFCRTSTIRSSSRYVSQRTDGSSPCINSAPCA